MFIKYNLFMIILILITNELLIDKNNFSDNYFIFNKQTLIKAQTLIKIKYHIIIFELF